MIAGEKEDWQSVFETQEEEEAFIARLRRNSDEIQVQIDKEVAYTAEAIVNVVIG